MNTEFLQPPSVYQTAIHAVRIPQMRALELAFAQNDRAAVEDWSHGEFTAEYDKASGVAVLSLTGMISPHFRNSWLSRYVVDPRDVRGAIEESVISGARVIFLNIDSPGGHVTGLVPLVATIKEARDAGVKVVAFTEGMMASAAYWIGASADEVVASSDAEVGSVGVYNYIYDASEYLKKEGIETIVFRDGELKGIGIFGKEVTEKERAHIQADVDEISAQFKGHIRSRRPGIQDSTMQGQCFCGEKAVGAKLVDRLVNDPAVVLAGLMES